MKSLAMLCIMAIVFSSLGPQLANGEDVRQEVKREGCEEVSILNFNNKDININLIIVKNCYLVYKVFRET